METLSKRDSLRKGDLLQVKYTGLFEHVCFIHPAWSHSYNFDSFPLQLTFDIQKLLKLFAMYPFVSLLLTSLGFFYGKIRKIQKHFKIN